MSPAKIASLRAIGQDAEIDFRVSLNGIFAETSRYLDRLARSVRECKDVNEAANFCRWLQMSGLISLLEKNSTPESDYRSLHKKLRDIIYDCGELYKGGRANAKYAASDIAEINDKLELIARHLFPSSVVVASSADITATQKTLTAGRV